MGALSDIFFYLNSKSISQEIFLPKLFNAHDVELEKYPTKAIFRDVDYVCLLLALIELC